MIPLSFAQQRLWFIGKLEGPNPTYNVPLSLRLSGPLNKAALEAALQDVGGRHEALRTLFREQDGVPYQVILDPADAAVPLEHRRVSEAELTEAIRACHYHLFDLSSEPPFRAWLLELGPDEHVLVLLMHHIITDEWSVPPLTRDLSTAYSARAAGTAPQWEELQVQYRHYTLWQQELLAGEDDPNSVVSRQLKYWCEALDGLGEELCLPFDRPRPPKPSQQGAHAPFELDPRVYQALLDLAQDTHTTLFMVLQAAVAVMLTRTGAGTDVPVGVPVAGRTDEALEDVVGFFVNTLVLRTDTSGDPTFIEMLERVRRIALGAFDNQDLPFDRLVEVLNPVRSRARNPLVQIMLVLEAGLEFDLDLTDLDVTRVTIDWDRAKFDLVFGIVPPEGDDAPLTGFVEYATDLFDRRTGEMLAARLVQVLEAVAADPRIAVSEIDIASSGDAEQVDSNTGWWIESLTGAPASHSLPRREGAAADVARSAVTVHREIAGEALDLLDGQCERLGVGAVNVVHSALALAVCNMSYEVDVVIGVSMADMKALPLRTTITGGDLTFAGIVDADHARLADALERTHYRMDEVLKACAPVRDKNRNALYQVMLSFGDVARAVDVPKLDLIVDAVLADGSLKITWEYDSTQFTQHTIGSLIEDFENWLSWGLAQPHRPIREYPGSDDSAPSVQQTAATMSVYERFLAEWDGRWQEVAFIDEGVELTAGQLHHRVVAMAERLAEAGVVRGSVVACRSRKTLDHVLSFFASSRLGAVHQPIDVASPSARTAAVLERCETAVVVSDPSEAVVGYRSVSTADLADDLPITPAQPSDPAAVSHIISTSGSTGQPKIFSLSNGSIDSYVMAARDAHGVSGTAGAQCANLGYDFFIAELVLSILMGNRMAVLPEKQRADPAAFARFVRRERIGTMILPTSYWSYLVTSMSPEDFDCLRELEVCLTGGEDYAPTVAQTWFKALDGGPRLFNVYGPAENNPISLVKELRPDAPASIIGFPIGDVRCRVRSRFGSTVPAEGRGELVLSGPQLFDGYLGGERVEQYPTADIVIFQREHGYKFIERDGSMMKISGFRVEAAEYVTPLSNVPGIADVRVRANADRTGVVIYCQVDGTASDEKITEVVGRLIHTSLPQYMRSYELRFCNEVQMTSNGKADFKALHEKSWAAPVPAAAASGGADAQGPRAGIRAAWAQVFGSGGLDESRGFFDQGGTSMTMLRLLTALNERFEGCFELVDLYELPSIDLQTRHVEERLRSRAQQSAGGAGGSEPTARDRLNRKRQARRGSGTENPQNPVDHKADMESGK